MTTGAMAPKGARELRALRFCCGRLRWFRLLYLRTDLEVSNRTLLAKQKGGLRTLLAKQKGGLRASFCYETGATAIPLA